MRKNNLRGEKLTGALILITTKVGSMRDIYNRIKDIEGVKQVEMLTGPYDIMVIAEAEEMTDITKALMEKVRKIEGVEDTVTNVFIE